MTDTGTPVSACQVLQSGDGEFPDGGITFGYGNYVSEIDYMIDLKDKNLYNKYLAPGTPFNDGLSLKYKPVAVPNSKPI